MIILVVDFAFEWYIMEYCTSLGTLYTHEPSSHLLFGCKPKGDKEGPTRRLRAGCNLDGNKLTGSEQRENKGNAFRDETKVGC